MTFDRRKIDIAMASALIAAAIIILTNDGLSQGGVETELGSLFLPRIVAICMIGFAATVGVQSLLKLRARAPKEDVEEIGTDGFGGVFIYLGIFIAYWLAVPHIGFVIATPPVMMAIAVLLGGRSWIAMGLMSVITPLAIYHLSYEFLRVFLPTWSL